MILRVCEYNYKVMWSNFFSEVTLMKNRVCLTFAFLKAFFFILY